MKKLKIIITFFLFSSLQAFTDPELEKLWDSIPDITSPTIDDYQKIEIYLTTKRSFLDVLSKQTDLRYERIMSFRLLGPNGEMPLFEQYSFNIREDTEKRCVLLYGSYNGIYYNKVYTVLRELKDSGYSGHVLVRVGGFPNLANGDLKLCHIPYAFKVAFFREAKELGYKHILWLDSAMHPLTDLELIFREIQEKGYFLLSCGTLAEVRPPPNPEAIKSLCITPEIYSYIPHTPSGVLGINLEKSLGQSFLENWHFETQKVTPCISWYPEELSLAVVTWNLGWSPTGCISTYCCDENQLHWALPQRPLLQVYLDGRR